MGEAWKDRFLGEFQCAQCGALYEVAITRLSAPVYDEVICEVCRRVMNEWRGTVGRAYIASVALLADEPEIDMFASMAGKCSTLKVAERDFACTSVAFSHSPGGNAPAASLESTLALQHQYFDLTMQHHDRTMRRATALS
jgi:hypothetical protein